MDSPYQCPIRLGHVLDKSPFRLFSKQLLIIQCKNHWIYLDGRLVRKISKRHFFQDIKKSFHGVTQMGPKPHQIFFWKNISTNMVARGVRSFGILEGASGTLIEICPKFFCQFSADIWWTNAENFKAISWFT